MRHILRFLYFLLMLFITYIFIPIVLVAFTIVYLFWNFKWIPKAEWNKVTRDWQMVVVGHFGKTIEYPTPLDYLRKTNGRKTGWINDKL